jgi:catechol 2,3-dioxygenase-like lactoylglutathione lyase family enzyme
LGGIVLNQMDFWPTLPAADMERAKLFYAEKLGLSPMVDTEAWVSYRTGSTIFQLYPTSSAGTAEHTLGGWVTDDLAATVAELRERGVVFEGYDMPGLRTVDGITELGGVERAAWFRESEFLTDPIV